MRAAKRYGLPLRYKKPYKLVLSTVLPQLAKRQVEYDSEMWDGPVAMGCRNVRLCQWQRSAVSRHRVGLAVMLLVIKDVKIDPKLFQIRMRNVGMLKREHVRKNFALQKYSNTALADLCLLSRSVFSGLWLNSITYFNAMIQ